MNISLISRHSLVILARAALARSRTTATTTGAVVILARAADAARAAGQQAVTGAGGQPSAVRSRRTFTGSVRHDPVFKTDAPYFQWYLSTGCARRLARIPRDRASSRCLLPGPRRRRGRNNRRNP